MNVDGFLSDILREPGSLDGLAAVYPLESFRLEEPPKRVLFLGMGSSRYAALAAASLLRSVGIDAYAEMASTDDPATAAAGNAGGRDLGVRRLRRDGRGAAAAPHRRPATASSP